MKTNLAQLIVAAALGATATLAFHPLDAHASSAPAAAPVVAKGPSYAERMERGKQIAGAVCVACHGLDGYSPIPANPNIGGMPTEYIAKQLALYKSGARPNAIMQGMSAGLSDADMQALGTYYFAQRGKTAAVARDERACVRKLPRCLRRGYPGDLSEARGAVAGIHV
jgi:cytochrome c553